MTLPLDDFIELKASPNRPPQYDWSDDGCSFPGLSPIFGPACERHDFGYRNYGASNDGRWMDAQDGRREWIDKSFREDMLRLCFSNPLRVVPGVPTCTALALSSYQAAHDIGGPFFFGDD